MRIHITRQVAEELSINCDAMRDYGNYDWMADVFMIDSYDLKTVFPSVWEKLYPRPRPPAPADTSAAWLRALGMEVP